MRLNMENVLAETTTHKGCELYFFRRNCQWRFCRSMDHWISSFCLVIDFDSLAYTFDLKYLNLKRNSVYAKSLFPD